VLATLPLFVPFSVPVTIGTSIFSFFAFYQYSALSEKGFVKSFGIVMTPKFYLFMCFQIFIVLILSMVFMEDIAQAENTGNFNTGSLIWMLAAIYVFYLTHCFYNVYFSNKFMFSFFDTVVKLLKNSHLVVLNFFLYLCVFALFTFISEQFAFVLPVIVNLFAAYAFVLSSKTTSHYIFNK
jgi:hypothetical protein